MTILCYHAVEAGWDSPLAVTPDAFARHCAWLARHRKVVPLDRAVALLDRRGLLPRGVTALTFDDGFASIYDEALPVLERYQLPATVFLVAETLTPAGRPVDWVDDPPDRPLTTLTPEQVLELSERGMAFGSHTWSHQDLTTLAPEACRRDLTASRELLEDLLGTRVPLLAYPRGRHDADVRAASADAGYEHAFALPESREVPGPHAIPRAGVFPGNGPQALRLKTARGYLRVRHSAAFPLLRRAARAVTSRGGR